jgi:glycosyltransferase involved in cell wall biosynthesis
MRILILNWRDIRSPKAGGAEALTHEVARRLATRHEVTWFTSRPSGHSEEEEIDRVHIVCRGSEFTTRLFAPGFARRGIWDVVVEEINTLPYFAPAWSRAPVVLFSPQLAREVWWYEAPRFLAPIGWAAEPLYLRVYRRVNAITISPSTSEDLRALGLRKRIDILPIAVSTPALSELPPKKPSGRLIAVGRLVPSKRFDHAVRALAHLRVSVPDARLTIIGEGAERENLTRLARDLRLSVAVQLTGRIPEERKARLLEDADVLVACSVREGWGLTPTEAARLGTPAVGYNVPGLRDSIIHGRTGLLSEPSPASLAAAITQLLGDGTYDSLRRQAWEQWRDLSWERTAESFEQFLEAAGPSRT